MKPKVKIVEFATGTDEEISAMLDAHYEGKIDISDYWHVGDTRLIHLNATYADNGITHSANHAAQNMSMVILGFNHDDLETPINGKTKAAITANCREILANNDDIFGEIEYYWGKTYSNVLNTDNYSANPLRKYLNNTFVNSMPETFKTLIKTVNKKNLARHTSTSNSPIETKDKAFLLSYPEVFGEETYTGYKGNSIIEGEQYDYYKINANRIKYFNNNGELGQRSYYYWLRSPSSTAPSSGYFYWCCVDGDGLAYARGGAGGGMSGLAPAFCL